MKLIWTRSIKPLSVFIRHLTGEDCSHFAFVFETEYGGEMFESNLLGTHIRFFKNAKKHFEIVHQIDLPLDRETEDVLWERIIDKYDDKPYDFKGALYLGWRLLLWRSLRFPIPKINAWSNSNAFYCDEIYDALDGIPGVPRIGASGGMETPYGVFQKLSGFSPEQQTEDLRN